MFKKIKQKLIDFKNWLKKWFALLIVGGATIVYASTLGGGDDTSKANLIEKYNASNKIKAEYQLDGASLVNHKIKNAELDKYKGEPKDEIKITLGDKDSDNFKPNIEMKRWNEVWFKIKTDSLLEGVPLEDRELEFSDNKIKFKTPEMEFEMEDFEDSYKFIWTLNEKPDSRMVCFNIESEGLDFYYQPPLDEEMAGQDCWTATCTAMECCDSYRPENIVGSYAVYHSTKGGMNDSAGMEYKVGKFGHIYRPHIYDSEGKECWGNLHIENGIYSVEIPQDFLDKAIYPIRSNDEFGNEVKGGSSSYVGDGNNPRASWYSGVNGTLDSITCYYQQYSTKTPKLEHGLYERTGSDDGSLVADSVSEEWTLTSSWDNWKTLDCNSSPTLVDSENYWISIYSDDAAKYYYDGTDAVDRFVYKSGSYSNKWMSSFTSGTLADKKLSIYCTYTPGGGEEEEEERRFFMFD